MTDLAPSFIKALELGRGIEPKRERERARRHTQSYAPHQRYAEKLTVPVAQLPRAGGVCVTLLRLRFRPPLRHHHMPVKRDALHRSPSPYTLFLPLLPGGSDHWPIHIADGSLLSSTSFHHCSSHIGRLLAEQVDHDREEQSERKGRLTDACGGGSARFVPRRPRAHCCALPPKHVDYYRTQWKQKAPRPLRLGRALNPSR